MSAELAGLFMDRVMAAMEDWANVNRAAIGDKWHSFIIKQIRKLQRRRLRRIPSVAEALAIAMWSYSTLAQLGVAAGLTFEGPPVLRELPPGIDQESTLKVLYLSWNCLALQCLHREGGGKVNMDKEFEPIRKAFSLSKAYEYARYLLGERKLCLDRIRAIEAELFLISKAFPQLRINLDSNTVEIEVGGLDLEYEPIA